MSTIEKSKDMESRYEGGQDTWGNRERRLYQSIFKAAVEKVKKLLRESGVVVPYWYDVGCGGGNIWDTVLENFEPGDVVVGGCDISQKAIDYLSENYVHNVFSAQCIDLEEYDSQVNHLYGLGIADVVSIVDVAYYFGEKRDYRKTMDEIWKTVKPGAVVVVADSLIPYQRREYFRKKEDAALVEKYTDYTTYVSSECSGGRHWHRYFKVCIYKKL